MLPSPEFPCDGIGHNPGFRLGQDQVVRKGDAFRDLVVVFGNVLVEGHVCGDLSVTLGDVRIASGASVEGTLVVVGGKATIEPGASVGQELVLVGGTLDAPADFRPGREQIVVGVPLLGTGLRQSVPYITRGLLLGRLIVPDIGWVWGVVAVLFFVQLLLNLLFPRATAASATIIAERPLSTFMAGVLVLVLTGPVVALLAVTVIGIAVLPVLFGGLLIAWIVGKVAVNRWIGTRLFEQDDMESRVESTRSFVIGFVVITITYMIPLLGVVVWGLSGVLGLGAATLAFVRGYRRENPPAVRAPRETPPVPPPPVPPSPFEAAALGATPALAEGAGAGDADLSMHRSTLGDTYTMPPPAFAGAVPPAAHASDFSLDPRALLAYPRASFGERAAAFALDVLLVGMLTAMSSLRDPSDYFVQVLVVYHVAFWFWKATTLGGIICQLRVVRVDGAPLRFVDVLVRGLVGVFSIATFGLGALWILRDPERQSWHDKVSGTVVVRVPKHYPLP
ncbi:RDD family protein [Luteitalea pratensis]|uniref:RDD family protein n=2 Tax=Luteitalea pratensis TaxID=1855912 RepID=A0A143PHS4_LUTPR|nr:RDD family protein [Luteitalea pratensis]